MKKFLFILAALFMPMLVQAKYQTIDIPIGGALPFSQAVRVMHFTSARNWQDVEGRVLVCLHHFIVKENPPQCLDAKQENAWVGLESLSLPGYEISYIEFKFVGYHNLSRQLFVYFRKKQ